MATAKTPAVADEFVENADVTQSPDGWEWNVVSEGTPTTVIFEEPGESFIGQYKGVRHIERPIAADGSDQSFDLFIFKGRDGELYSINQSYTLVEAMKGVTIDMWCRITYTKSVKVNNWPTPMKDFKVAVRA